VCAFVGLVAVTAEAARRLPSRAIELPMLAVSSGLQASLRAQQRYARLAARGEDVLNHRTPSEEPPSWATFDEPAVTALVRDVSKDTLAAAGEAPAPPTGKTISRPRNAPPSRFDDVQDL
jgi:hypothetical protein